MSILPICITGEPVLHRVAAPIETFDSELSDLVADMIETMHAAPGVGLAAPQVGVGSQVFVWRYGGAGSFDTQYRDVLQLDEGPARGFHTALHGVVVNPTLDLVWDTEGAGAILPDEPDVARESEGCLSVPGYGYPVRSCAAMTWTATPSRSARADGSRASSSTNTTTCRAPSTSTASSHPTPTRPSGSSPSADGAPADTRGPRGSGLKPLPPGVPVRSRQWTMKPSERK